MLKLADTVLILINPSPSKFKLLTLDRPMSMTQVDWTKQCICQNISNFVFIYRRECAYNFPAMVIFVGPSSFIESLYSTFAGLAADPVAKVRKTLASSLHELAKLVGTSFNTTKVQIVRLFHGKNNP